MKSEGIKQGYVPYLEAVNDNLFIFFLLTVEFSNNSSLVCSADQKKSFRCTGYFCCLTIYTYSMTQNLDTI